VHKYTPLHAYLVTWIKVTLKHNELQSSVYSILSSFFLWLRGTPLKDDTDFSKSEIRAYMEIHVFLSFKFYKSLLSIFKTDSEYIFPN